MFALDVSYKNDDKELKKIILKVHLFEFLLFCVIYNDAYSQKTGRQINVFIYIMRCQNDIYITHRYIHTHMHAYMHIYIHAYTHKCAHSYIHIHTKNREYLNLQFHILSLLEDDPHLHYIILYTMLQQSL